MSNPLTRREREVLAQLATGSTAAGIGRRLQISERTVHKHLENVYAKLEVHDRLGAVLRAVDLGLLARPLAGEGRDRADGAGLGPRRAAGHDDRLAARGAARSRHQPRLPVRHRRAGPGPQPAAHATLAPSARLRSR